MPARIIAVILVKPDLSHRLSGRCTVTHGDVRRLSIAHITSRRVFFVSMLAARIWQRRLGVAARHLHQLKPCALRATVYAKQGSTTTMAQGFVFTEIESQFTEDTNSHCSAVQNIAVAPTRRANSHHQSTRQQDLAIEIERPTTGAILPVSTDRAHFQDYHVQVRYWLDNQACHRESRCLRLMLLYAQYTVHSWLLAPR
jgi:hypothetical protein